MFGGSIGSPQRTNGGASFANVPAFGGGAGSSGFGNNLPRGAGAPVRATTTPATTPDYSKWLSSYDYDCIVELIKEFESPEVLAKLCALEACLNKFFKLSALFLVLFDIIIFFAFSFFSAKIIDDTTILLI